MRRSIRALARIAIVGLAVSLPVAPTRPASAHQHRHVNGFDTTVGWSEEPAYSGFKNAVVFIIEGSAGEGDHADEGSDEHAEGTPIEDAELEVEVFFGAGMAGESIGPMELAAAFGSPGEYRAFLVPTRPGTYTFHVFGTAGGQEIDEVYTSGEAGANEESEGTFNDMQNPTDVQFPERDLTGGEVTERLDRLDARLAASTGTDTMTVLALILAGIGLLVAGIAVARKGPAGS